MNQMLQQEDEDFYIIVIMFEDVREKIKKVNEQAKNPRRHLETMKKSQNRNSRAGKYNS